MTMAGGLVCITNKKCIRSLALCLCPIPLSHNVHTTLRYVICDIILLSVNNRKQKTYKINAFIIVLNIKDLFVLQTQI